MLLAYLSSTLVSEKAWKNPLEYSLEYSQWFFSIDVQAYPREVQLMDK